jgi:5'-3' exonuclease
MNVHAVDGTSELFRYFYAVPAAPDGDGKDVGAARGVLASVLGLIEGGATHVGVATDHVIESFRNDLYAGYKTSEGIDPALFAQFPVLEEGLESMGVVVWPMVQYEADDAMAAAGAKAALDERVEQVFLCTPDKDLAQSVVGTRVVQLDRRRGIVRDEDGVIAKWGVRPESIPDYLAVVGDTADGYPGVPGWGAKSSALVFAKYGHLEQIPRDWREWDSSIRGAQRLCTALFERWDEALLYRRLATLRLDVPVFEQVDDLAWCGPRPGFEEFCGRLQAPGLHTRALTAMQLPAVASARERRSFAVG